MNMDGKARRYTLDIPLEFRRILEKIQKADARMVVRLEKQLVKVLRNPNFGKPMRNVLRNYRRVHVDPFVLIYEIRESQIRLIDFDHHDRVYKKYSP